MKAGVIMELVMDMNKKDYFTLAALASITLIIISLVLAGSLADIRKQERFVSVRGLSKRQVLADQALWPLNFRVTANTLPEIYTQITASQKNIIAFLKEQGFSDEEIHIKQTNIQDTSTDTYSQRQIVRYIADAGVLVKTAKIDSVKSAIQKTDSLIAKGITLSSGSVQYTYTKLNEIKPAMIEEATKEALKAARRFAKDSGSKVGKIRRAYQGLFTIDPIHYYSPEIKKVRVVIDMEYYIK